MKNSSEKFNKDMQNHQSRKKFVAKFNLKEFGGALGDWGTLIPFIIGYISIVGLNPAGVFLCLGITNIILGIKFNLPLPVQPQKTIGTIAISQAWSPNLVISTGFGTGVIWALLGFTKFLEKIVRKVPQTAVRGIQLGLGLILGWTAIQLISPDIVLGIISLSVIILSLKFKKIPSSIVLVVLGIILIVLNQSISLSDIEFKLPIFDFHIPRWDNILWGMVVAGLAQLFLTLTNVMIATVSLIKELFPEKEEDVSASDLALNMGLMNIFTPFLGGIPLCHGSGGLASQYAFGARTGGSMILEGLLEIFLGLFLSETLLSIFTAFPKAILGAMLFYTAFLLAKISFKDYSLKTLPIIVTSAILCLIFNITIGFVVGLGMYFILILVEKKLKNSKERDLILK
ncbi:MAG: putative sulfate/molybdate transporter [Candidatus Lokiarchaeota archaeon]|jgi:MFS superfamily sulfate permease-like transporter|nr:putative sulfate/molybdate transporter [Candidatus Lokiarchaeota archaeon]